MLTTALTLVAASLLKLGGAERRINRSHILHTEAKNAAESMVEYGFAELRSRWQRQTSFPINALRSAPLAIPPTASTFFAGTGVDYDMLELVGGQIPPGDWRFIDPADPANINDPQKGKLVFSRGVQIYGRAIANHASLGSRQAYCTQTLLVRDAPLFSHAIFYNMDLEFHPGPRMEIQGPVHANGNIYVQAVNRLRFHSTLMAGGDIIYGFKGSEGEVTQTGDVQVKDGDGNWTTFYKGGDRNTSSSYYASDETEDWRETATNRWDGNVGSQEHGVPKMNPVGIGDYMPDDPDTIADEKFNPSYALIEPIVADDHPNFKGEEVRNQQLAYKAGLVFRVNRVVDAGAPGGYDYTISAHKYRRESQTNPKSDVLLEDGAPKIAELDLALAEQRLGKSVLSVNRYSEDGDGRPTGGFYDRRQEQALDVVELDVGALAELIEESVSGASGNDPWNGQFHINPGSAVDWNGVVYVEMPFDPGTSRPDKVMPGSGNVALRLNNGSEVPNPDFSGSSEKGFTLATNGQLYVKGHFNSDGNSSTGSSTETDDAETFDSDEAPVALFADAITILSQNFADPQSKESPSSRKATFTEVSAALVTGLLPTDPGGTAQSGGAHNLPRFLEDWGGVEFRYRGSLVALYESEVGNKPMTSNHSSWYRPPNRNWGFNDLFADGIYPPGTPNTRDFRRTDFRFLTASEYAAELALLDGFDPTSDEDLGHGTPSCSVGP